MADLRLAAEENPAVAEMLTAVSAVAARIEDLIQRGPAAPISRGGGLSRGPRTWRT
ncbi:hypothetical protein [Kitasatospora sp. NPDC017646]|uniref:hypothetical protein n=1 Tax=Kitasatospora sp. NPDC017646 TaxID=3364024 RepID=UPI0037B72A2F